MARKRNNSMAFETAHTFGDMTTLKQSKNLSCTRQGKLDLEGEQSISKTIEKD
jgi:hypothetical protein